MVKSGLGLFAGRRKSQGNIIEDAEPKPVPDATPAPETSSGGFRLMSTSEAEARKREEKRRAQEKAASKFRPFSSFAGNHNKARNHSFDDDGSPASSKRDSKSSSGTQSSRPYNNAQFGSTSTLPSSADTDSNDNIFAIPRPQPSHHNSSPQSLSLGATKKDLPALPKASTAAYGDSSHSQGFGRVRAMTSSSYASTAKPPTLDAEMNFGSTSFDDLFSGLDRNETPDNAQDPAGRSLLAGKRTFQAEPIRVDNKLEVEAPLTSWESRGSNENLISAPRSPDDDSPPPVPPHKYSKYAPVASESPSLHGTDGFDLPKDKPAAARASANDSSPERHTVSQTSSSAPSLETSLSSRSGSNTTTPKAVLRAGVGSGRDDDENLFTAPKPKPAPAPAPKPAAPASKNIRPPPSKGGQRIMSQAEFRAQQQRQSAERHDTSSDEEDYEDEEEAIEKAQQEAIARRKNQKMDLARASMIRSTTAPARPDSIAEPHRPGFPSEVSMQAEEWDDEDIPIGILAQHGFPGHGKPPTQPANAKPSYIPNQFSLPERPASTGGVSNRQSQAFKPVFARNLPEDPYANSSHIGGGLVRPSVRESMGFNRGPASVAGDSVAGMGMPMVYPEPQMSAPSLVDQIQMRDMTKQKYMGGASSKKPAPQGPFTGLLGAQMNAQSANAAQTRMSIMGGMPGMPAPNGMMAPNMMGAPMGMPMMGMGGMGMNGMGMNGMGMNGMAMNGMAMNGMAYPMAGNDMMQMQQMQQMINMQQAQLAQLQAMTQQGSQAGSDPRMSIAQDPRMSMVQDPRMSMVQDPRMSMASFGGNFLNVPGGPASQRPMSIMQQQPRPFSTPHQMGGFAQASGPVPGYTPSIAPSERSNIGLSARYRPVATTHQDNKSSVSNHTALQVSGGATQGSQTTVKGILKHKTPPVQEEDEAWGNMASRKKKSSAGGAASKIDPLRELTEGLDRL